MKKLTRDEIKTLIEGCDGRPTMIPVASLDSDGYQLGGYFKRNGAIVITEIITALPFDAYGDDWLERLQYVESQTEVLDWDSRDSGGWQTVLRFKEAPIEAQ